MNALFVTSNDNKAREAAAILGVKLKRADFDLPELQALDVGEVAAQKARAAREITGPSAEPVLVEDAGLAVEAWDGFPGALTKWLLGSVGPEGVCRMLAEYPDRRARAVCAVAVVTEDEERILYGEVAGTIAPAPRGEHGFGFDPIFIPEGSEYTYAQMGEDKHADSHRARAFRAARRWFSGS